MFGKSRAKRYLATVLLSLLAASCGPEYQLDEVARSVERYGTVSVSAPMLVDVDASADGFSFDLDKPATFYYDASRVEGGFQAFRAESVNLQAALSMQVEELMKTLAEMRTARTAARQEAIRQRLTSSLLVINAVNQIAQAQGAALTQAALAANPELAAGVALLQGIATTTPPGTPKPMPKVADMMSTQPPPDTDTKADAGSAAASAAAAAATAGAGADTGNDGGEKDEKEGPPPFAQPRVNSAAAVLPSATFSTPYPNLGSFTISPRQAIALAANDKMSQDLFKFLARPKNFGDNKKAYFCIFTVSCQPGRTTQQNFVADVMVTTEYARKDLKPAQPSPKPRALDTREVELLNGGAGATPPSAGWKVNYASGRPSALASPVQGATADSFSRPAVAAVYPMVDSQVLDLAFSLRQQMAIATSLALRGFGAQAEQIADTVKRIEQDARTRSAFTVGSAYSAGGYNFGFRIEPRYMALKNPEKADDGPGSLLESIEFPAMVVLFCEKSELAKSVGGTQPEGQGYNNVVFHIESRWIPRTAWTALWKRQSEVDVVRLARSLDETRMGLANAKYREDRRGLESSTLLRRRWMLAAASLGASVEMELPTTAERAKVVVGASRTFDAWVNAPSAFAVQGSGFKNAKIEATIGGRRGEVIVVSNTSLLVVIDALRPGTASGTTSAAPIELPLRLATPDGVQDAGTVKFTHQSAPPPPDPAPRATILRDNAGNIIGVRIDGDTNQLQTAKELLQIIKDALGKAPNFHLQFEAAGRVGAQGGAGASGS